MRFAFDTETTGLDVNWHEAIEIAACVMDDKTNLPTSDTFHRLVKVEKPERVGEGVLGKFNHYDEKVWGEKAIPQYQAWQELSDWIYQKSNNGISKAVMCGCNVTRFDLPLAEHWFKAFGLRANISHHSDDIIPQYQNIIRRRKEKLGKSSLKDICGFYGFENPNAHSALSDAMAASLCFALGEVYQDVLIDCGVLGHSVIMQECWHRLGKFDKDYQPLRIRT